MKYISSIKTMVLRSFLLKFSQIDLLLLKPRNNFVKTWPVSSLEEWEQQGR